MSYPPYQGGYPNPPNNGGQGGIGFSGAPQSGQGGGFSYPDPGSGFPCPPSNPVYPNFSNQSPAANLPYSLYPQASNPSPSFSSPYAQPSVQPSSASAPYPPSSNMAPYPPQYNASSAFASPFNAPYSPAPATNSPYPPAPAINSTYPPAPSSFAPYPPAAASTNPYPNVPPSISPYSSSNTSNMYSSSPTAMPQQPLQSESYPYSSQTPMVSNPQNVSFYGSSASQSKASSTSQVSAGCMFPYQERPTVRPAASFDPSTDAAQLRKAMKGFGTNEAALIQVLGRRTSQQRQQIMQRYQQSFGRDLIKDLKSELSGSFEAVMLALMTPLNVYLAQELNAAIIGLGTNEKTLIEILCTNDNNTLRNIKIEYQRFYGKPLEADLKGDTSGAFMRLMVSMAAAFRDEANNNTSLAPGLAQSLYNAGAKKIGTDEAEFNRILSSYSYPLLRCVFQEYPKVSGGKTFDVAIKSELSGDLREGMMALYDCINNRAAFYARYLQESMRGMGTKDRALIRIIVSRCEIDMGNIKDEYRKAYGKRLEDAVMSETSGDYKKILLALIQG